MREWDEKREGMMGGGEKQDLCYELIHSIIQSHENCNEEIYGGWDGGGGGWMIEVNKRIR